MIPHTIFQTWHTTMFHPKVMKRRYINKGRMMDYEYRFFLDDEMDKFVTDHFDEEVVECYNKLRVRKARVDLWRYLVLYTHGGVYLDMDAGLNLPISYLVDEGDNDAIIAIDRKNPNVFAHWAIACKPAHPLLKEVVRLVVNNIKHNKYPDDIYNMTGGGAFTQAVFCFHRKHFEYPLSTENSDVYMDIRYEYKDVKYRILGSDFNGHMSEKYVESPYLFESHSRWNDFQNTVSLLLCDDHKDPGENSSD